MPHESVDAVSDFIRFFRENADYIDTAYLNYFRLIESCFYNNRDEYGISIPEGYIYIPENLYLGFMYDETDGLKWDMIKRIKRIKKELVIKDLKRTNSRLLHRVGQHFIFALYDIFDNDKEKVREYYKRKV
jgi:hypothetical protein